MATPPPQDESDSESESSSEEIQKPVTKGKKQVAKESTPNVEIKKAAPKVTSKAASIWETSAKVMGNRGSIGVELDLDFEETKPKQRRVVDDGKKKKKARRYDSSSSEDEGTLSDWEGVESYTGKTTVRYEAPPKSLSLIHI